MNELSTETKMTTKEVADFLKTSAKVVLENARKCLPSKVIENGKTTYWNKAEITVLIEQLKNSNPNQHTFTGAVKGISTELTPALKIKKAFDLMQEGYQEELERLKAENERQHQKLIEQAPKVLAYDDFLSREKFCNFRDAANYLHITQTELMDLLKTKYIYRNSVNEYRAYGKYAKYFTLRPFAKGKNRTGQQLMMTIEGLEYFKKLMEGGEV